MKSPLEGRESGSIQQVLELRGIKTRTGLLNAGQIAMPQDGPDARKTVVKSQRLPLQCTTIISMSLIGITLKSSCRNAQRPEKSCQYGYCKLENLIPFLLVLFCHNLFCFKRLIIPCYCLRSHCRRCFRSGRQRFRHLWFRHP